MRLFAPALAFVDLETTGTRAADDRVTEVGIVRVECDAEGGTPRVDEWSSLVDPGVPIPPVIQSITGITDAMVRRAPTFPSLWREIAARLEGAVFVAHNARFDYGFLKHEFARVEHAFAAKVLCTVRLSRRLYPDARSHGLDAVIARLGLVCGERHRALGDARALWHFVQAMYRAHPPEAIEDVVRRLLKTSSLPPQLAPDVLEHLPEGPGIYLFYGDNPLPLYIGKSRHLRERVASHFSADWRSETDQRLSAEVRRIDVETTAGELGALLREATLVKALMPAHNRALRRKAEAGVMRFDEDGGPRFLPAGALDDGAPLEGYGPFSSKRAMRETLMGLAHDHALCWRRLALERRSAGPCFGRQVRKCAGACDGGEPAEVHDARLRQALAPLAIPAWPWSGPALVREATPDGARCDVHVLQHWRWLGTARDDGELERLLEAPPRPTFDLDVTRLLLRLWARQPSAFVPVPVPASEPYPSRAGGDCAALTPEPDPCDDLEHADGCDGRTDP